jgi:hypothetical protein
VVANLHVILAFSPGSDMRARGRRFPALVNCTVIDWFQPWPKDALTSVAKRFLSDVKIGLGSPSRDEEVRGGKATVRSCVVLPLSSC